MKTEQELWDIIESANWISDNNYERISNEWKQLNPEVLKQLNDFIDEKIKYVSDKFYKDWLGDPGIDVSDDGWIDLTAEVVGRGKHFFKNISLSKLQQMAKTNDYNECFSYCLFTNEKK